MEKYNIGEQVDVLDENGIWSFGQITQVKNIKQCNNKISDKKVRVLVRNTREFWLNYNQVMKQWQQNENQIRINNRLYAYCQLANKFKECRVIEIDESKNKVKVHFKNETKLNDIWVEIKNMNEVKSISNMQKERDQMKKGQKNDQIQEVKQKEGKQKLDYNDEKEREFIQLLGRQNLEVVFIEMDGNCVFRCFSHQIYGKDIYFKELRELTMQYIILRKEHFQNFIAGDIEKYCEFKKQDGIWGDDVEIQALSELYSRNVEIYSYAIHPLQRLSAHPNDQPPIRISYHFNCHYNSIIHHGVKPIFQPHFGIIEAIPIHNAKLYLQTQRQNQALLKFQQQEIENQKNTFLEQQYIEQQLLSLTINQQDQFEKEQLQQVLNESRLSNPVIKQVVEMGVSIDLAEKVMEIVGNDPEAIITYIYDKLLLL